MIIKKTKFKGLKIVTGKIYYDSRGFFKEIFKKKIFKEHKPIFWCMFKSKKNVLRGLHLQTKNIQEKFISVIKGKILDVVVDLRHNSKSYGKHYKVTLSDKNGCCAKFRWERGKGCGGGKAGGRETRQRPSISDAHIGGGFVLQYCMPRCEAP